MDFFLFSLSFLAFDFFFFLIPVNEIHRSLLSCLLLGQTVSLTFLSRQLARSVPGRRPASARLWEPSCCSLQGPRGWAGCTGEALARLLSSVQDVQLCPGGYPICVPGTSSQLAPLNSPELQFPLGVLPSLGDLLSLLKPKITPFQGPTCDLNVSLGV